MTLRRAAVAAALTAVCTQGWAESLQGYAHDDDLPYRNKSWMGRISGDRRLTTLSIPGTHDSISMKWGDIAVTQTLELGRQLEVGIRALDIRLRCKDGILKGYHRLDMGITFDQILETMAAFLQQNRDEALFVRISNDAGTDDCADGRGWQDLFDAAYASQRWNGFFWKPPADVGPETDPTLADVRGKIVVFEDFARRYKNRTYAPYGLPYVPDRCQDHWNLHGIGDLYKKWEKVKDALNEAALPREKREPRFRFLVCNYLSGSYDASKHILVVMPYFVASGHSSPQTNAPRLSTGLSGPRQKFHYTYPDFPRHDYGTKRNPQVTILYEGTNVLAMHWLRNHHPGYTGIVFMDFPGKDLIAEIVLANQNYR